MLGPLTIAETTDSFESDRERACRSQSVTPASACMNKKKRTKLQPTRIYSTLRRGAWILIALTLVSGVVAVAVFRPWPLTPSGKGEAGQTITEAVVAPTFGPTIAVASPAPTQPPHGMVWIPGGEFSMGAMDPPAVNEVGMYAAASDWYRPDYYQELAAAGGVTRNPQRPDTPYDPDEPTERKRVHRGGSFLCTDQYCSRYVVGTRGKGEVSTATNHLSFRCVRPVTAMSTNVSLKNATLSLIAGSS
jgi:formylglycine-generating enzyme required for sulfatase activity